MLAICLVAFGCLGPDLFYVLWVGLLRSQLAAKSERGTTRTTIDRISLAAKFARDLSKLCPAMRGKDAINFFKRRTKRMMMMMIMPVMRVIFHIRCEERVRCFGLRNCFVSKSLCLIHLSSSSAGYGYVFFHESISIEFICGLWLRFLPRIYLHLFARSASTLRLVPSALRLCRGISWKR
jgi:hypothetical protein